MVNKANRLGEATIVLVGCGQMGSALAEGVVRSGRVKGEQVICLDHDSAKASALAERIGARTEFPEDDAEAARIWIIAVKPKDVGDVLRTYARDLGDRDTIISIAAGLKLATLRAYIGSGSTGVALVRAMPNTPALVGRGVTGVMAEFGEDCGPAKTLFESVGHVVELKDEDQFNALTGLSGSGPAYIFSAIEALADGGVLMGLSRDIARELAVHTVAGAAAMVEADMTVHTAELKDRVASPAGTTITALASLEANGFRHALIEAVRSAALQSRKMSGDA